MKTILTPQEWKQLPPLEQEEIIATITRRWRERGFPHYNLTEAEKLEAFANLQRYNRSSVIKDGIVNQTMHGLGLAWSYFPHAWETKIKNQATPQEVWSDDQRFRKAILTRLENNGCHFDEHGADITASSLRKGLRRSTGVQAVSNFRPSAAAAIYDHYVPAGGTVWDMSCGWGGRLIGAIASRNVFHYIGTDPSTKTMRGLKHIKNELAHLTHTEVTLHCQGSETFTPEANSLDFAFTSPPYFNHEQYAQEATQSFMAYTTTQSWNENYLRPTLRNCFIGLKPHAQLILNVANVRDHKTLVEDVQRIAAEEGFTSQTTLQLALSGISTGGYKYEPILVWQKTVNENEVAA